MHNAILILLVVAGLAAITWAWWDEARRWPSE